MRSRLIALTGAAVVAAGSLTLPAAAAADPCVDGPLLLGEEPYYVEPVLADKTVRFPVAVNAGFGADCTGLTATLQTPGGTTKTLALDKDGVTQSPEPPIFTKYGLLELPVANGTGVWKVTGLTHGSEHRTVSATVTVVRKVLVTLDQPARTSGAAKTTLTGTVRQYNASGVTAPVSGASVGIYRRPHASVGSTKTDSVGRYSLSVLFTQNTTVYAEWPKQDYHWTSPTDVTAHKLLAMSYLNYAATAKVGSLWKVSGTAFPGKLDTALQIYTGTAWVSAGSAGPTAADGSYARYWKPTRAGQFRLRVLVSGPGLDNSPWNREAVVTVR